MSARHSFVRLNNIPWGVDAALSSSRPLLMDISVAPTFQLLLTTLQRTSVYQYLFEPLFSILLDLYLGLEFAESYGNLMLRILRDHQTVLHSSCPVLLSHQLHAGVRTSLHPLQHLGMKWCVAVVLIWLGWVFTSPLVLLCSTLIQCIPF